MRRLLPLLLLLAAACSRSPKEMAEAQRAAIEAKLEAVKRLFRELKPVPEEETLAAPDPAPWFDDREGNARLVPQARFDNPAHLGASWEAVIQALNGSFTGTAEHFAPWLESMLKTRYVFVIRTLEETPARQTGPASFEGGRWSGAVEGWDLEAGRHLGSVRCRAESSMTTTHVFEDFERAKWSAVREAIRRRIPGAKIQ